MKEVALSVTDGAMKRRNELDRHSVVLVHGTGDVVLVFIAELDKLHGR